jgi:hypothetical protein
MSDLNPATVLFDTLGQRVHVMTDDLAEQILTELKIMNVHLASLSGEEVTSEDVLQ